MCIHSSRNKTPKNPSAESRGILSAVNSTFHDQDASSSKSQKSNAQVVSKDMLEQVHCARAAVKEIASVIKSQWQDISYNDVSGDVVDTSQFLSPNAVQKSERSPPSAQFRAPAPFIKPPAKITTEVYEQIPSNHPTKSRSVERAIAPTPSNDGGTNLQMQLEDKHIAGKSAIKTKYREKIQ